MAHDMQFYIDGEWLDPFMPKSHDVINPSTTEVAAQISLGSSADVDRAVAAARRAFREFSVTSPQYRLDLLRRIIDIYNRRGADLARVISLEMGAPRQFAIDLQVPFGLSNLVETANALEKFQFRQPKGRSMVAKEAIGVVGLITPWNWPINQITSKVAPALAAGCTMVLKPSEVAPLDAIIFAEIMHEAGVPKGVFNLINGDGPTVGQAMSVHPDIDMISFTGSTRAGIQVARDAAATVKRVHQELGGKSANILFPDVDFAEAVTTGALRCFANSGQTCTAPTRMLVPRDRQDEATAYARAAAESLTVGPADGEGTTTGPVVSKLQFDKIQSLIEAGINEGAQLVAGGPGMPAGLNRGYFVQPTVFADVSPDMRIAKEEIFGPVLSIMPYDSEDEAIEIANGTPYGLAAYVQSKDMDKARAAAAQLRAGIVAINNPDWDAVMPFGGYKQSGNGHEGGEYGIDDFLELKGIVGYEPRPA